ncbi:hypothetical protein BD410DRAFT_207136 [Rickenella mellea]|uniref:GH16 domain-containing protein n=1 Tax=Rickenella mellea TaxID=50990 RepID=A0A4Y7Q563_9AGAM|nr:hypothetical protein BD410DRAFT_207136 [Rickenella mellea]
MHSLGVVGLVAVFCTTSARAAFTVAQNYQGSSFFDAWTFQNGPDRNSSSNVLYQTREQALQEGLVSVNAAGHAIIKMDNTTDGTKDPNFGRPSVFMLSNATVSAGSLVIMDAITMPFGCSVWPAFWMQGPNWPNNGEIDIVENVNLQTNNRYSLHTASGCTHPPADQSPASMETGQVLSTDCSTTGANGNQGCLIQDPSTNSFGAGFKANGGGAYAMLWDDTGIKIWFFPRASIPADASTNTPNPSGWPTPTAFYPSSSCDTTKFFGPQSIVLNINVCGSFPESNFNPSCSGKCQDLVGVPSNYNNAYFEISYLRVFTSKSGSGSSTTSGGTAAPKTTGSGSASVIAKPATIFTILATIVLPFIGGYLTVAL